MAMKPEDRYPSVRQLAAEVELWLADEPVEAYPEPVSTRLWRWMRRNKALVGTGMSTFVAVVAVAVGSWLVILEREKAELAREKASLEAAARIQDAMYQQRVSGPQLHSLLDQFDKSVRTSLDQMAARVGDDPRLDRPDSRLVRKEILLHLLAFWNDAIENDVKGPGGPGWRTDFLHLQRALCLVRLGDVEQAAEIANSVDSALPSRESLVKSEFDPAKRYDLARVYALCATASKDTGALAEQYCERAIKHLRAAAEDRYFKETAQAQRCLEERAFDFLRPREDFRKLLGEIEAKSTHR
jgi:hypothetical protein